MSRGSTRHAQTAGDLGFAVQFNAETPWHFAALVTKQEENVDLKKDISILKKEKDEMKEERKKMRDKMNRDQADLAN